MHEHEAPVVAVTICRPEDASLAIELLDRFREDFVMSLDVAQGELRLLSELDDEETVLGGESVSVCNVAYSTDELISIAMHLQEQLGRTSSEERRLNMRLSKIDRFVSELIERAERMSGLSEKARPLAEARADVLNRVLVRLREP